jgi:hypothetical protein
MSQHRIKLGDILNVGIKLNVQYGISPEEKAELAESEHLIAVITESGLVGLYHEPCARCEEYMPALHGCSAGGFLRRDDVRGVAIKHLCT